MGVTVRDCLRLPSLSMSKVMAGEKGLDSIVTAISVLEFDDREDDFFVPNEMLITSFYNARGDVAEQCQILRHSKASGNVAVVIFYADVIMEGISPEVINTANQINLPLIVMQGDNMGLRYSDVIYDVMEAVIMENRGDQSFVNNAIARISQMSAVERNLDTVLTLLSDRYNASFFLCDGQDRIIAKCYWPHNNEGEMFLFRQFLTDPSEQAGNPTQMFRMDVLGGQGHLQLFALSHNAVLTNKGMNASVELIQLFSTIWNYALDASRSEALIPPLLDGNIARAQIIAEDNHFRLSDYRSMMLLESADTRQTPSADLVDALRNYLKEEQIPALVDMRGKVLVVLSKHKLIDDPRVLSICGVDSHENIAAVYENIQAISDYHRLYSEFCYGEQEAITIFPEKTVFSSSQLSFAGRCKRLLTEGDRQAVESALASIEALIDGEAELLETLATYFLDADSEVKRTAELMHVHRNTVLYRLNKTTALLSADIHSMPFQYDVYLALGIWRLITGSTDTIPVTASNS